MNNNRNRSPVDNPDGANPQSDGTDTAAGAVTDSSSSSINNHPLAGLLPVTVPNPVWVSLGDPEDEDTGIETDTRSLEPSVSSIAETDTSADAADGPVNVTVEVDNTTPAGVPDNTNDRSAPTTAPANTKGTPNTSPAANTRFNANRSVAADDESPSDTNRSGTDNDTDVASSSATSTVAVFAPAGV